MFHVKIGYFRWCTIEYSLVEIALNLSLAIRLGTK